MTKSIRLNRHNKCVRTIFNDIKKSNHLSKKRKCCGLIFLFTLLFVCSVHSQISYEPGYFIDSSGQRTDCLIRNVDWMKNPSAFQYKFTEEGATKTGDLNSVKEFGLIDKSKYIKATVDLDSSSDSIDKLGLAREPTFSEETLFLKVLIEGKASLFVYEDNNGPNYYYNIDSSYMQPLIFKRYISADNRVSENNQYKQQLRNTLHYPNLSQKRLSNIDYNKKDLTKFFLDFNMGAGGEVQDFTEIKKRDLFNLTIRPGVRNSSLTLQSVFTSVRKTEYDNELSFRLGAELETILPFNKNKWSLFVEPSYQYYRSEKLLRADTDVPATVKYKAVELAIGARHYLYLNQNSKLFVNAAYVLAFGINSKIDYNNGFSLELTNGNNSAFGIGYNYKDTYSMEFNYHLERGTIGSLESKAIYNSFSVIFGYTLF